jgi:hypothetical protein
MRWHSKKLRFGMVEARKCRKGLFFEFKVFLSFKIKMKILYITGFGTGVIFGGRIKTGKLEVL